MHVCMYVSMYVCMHEFMYVCMVCMYVLFMCVCMYVLKPSSDLWPGDKVLRWVCQTLHHLT